MTWLDRYLQQWRIKKVLPHIPVNAALLDIGCHEGELLKRVKDIIKEGVGIDRHCTTGNIAPNINLIKGMFPQVIPAGQRYDCITALALLEHIPAESQTAFIKSCHDVLSKDGTLIFTVPAAAVDHVLNILVKLRLAEGMSLEEHFGFDAAITPSLAAKAGFKLLLHQRFQFGLNNLFVFVKNNGSG